MSEVRLRGISKSFGKVRAVREVSLEIERGVRSSRRRGAPADHLVRNRNRWRGVYTL